MVGVEPDLVDLERLRAVDVGHRHGHEFELHIHAPILPDYRGRVERIVPEVLQVRATTRAWAAAAVAGKNRPGANYGAVYCAVYAEHADADLPHGGPAQAA